jgi:succinoglycan biosynthesis transport protein ExoP
VVDESSEQQPLDIKKYLDMAIRQRWWILTPCFVAGLIAFVVAIMWPPMYQSQAVVLVEEQKVPTKYVTPNVVADAQSRLQSMKEQILSRTRLETIVKQFNLYGNTRMNMDEIVDKVRGDITIQVVESTDRRDEQPLAFRIFFSAQDPNIAQRVNNELTSLFIEKSLEARAQQSMSTTSFLQSQLEQAKKDLETQEEQLRQYKMKYLGELPQQEQSNLSILNSLELQLQSVTDSISRAEQQKIYLQSLRSEYKAMTQAGDGTVVGGGQSLSTAELALRDLRKQKEELEAKYTPNHPDLVRVKQEIAQWEELNKKNEEAAKAEAKKVEKADGGKADDDSTSTAAATGQPALAEVDSRLKAVDLEMTNDKKQAEKLHRQVDELRGRLSLTPVREQQLSEVTRNYQNSHEYYQSLLQKELESELASNLEKRQVGEQFRIIDPPSLPDKPFKPNRPIILLGGWAVGLGLGLGLAGAREFAKNTVRTAMDLRQHTTLPVLIHIPVFQTSQQRRSLRLQHLIELGVGVVLLCVSLAAAIYTYRLT